MFPDEYHLATLSKLLQACGPVHEKVNVKAIVISLVERLVNFFQSNRANGAGGDAGEGVSGVPGVPSDINLYQVFAESIRSLFKVGWLVCVCVCVIVFRAEFANEALFSFSFTQT